MTNFLNRLALASQRAAGLRTFQLLNEHDLPRLEAFFLSFDFDQRRGYFGGGISDQSIRDYCRAIDWNCAILIARGGPYCIEAVVTLVSLPSDHLVAELSVACPLDCNQQPIVAELLNLAIEVGALRYWTLLVRRELAHADLLCLLRESSRARFDYDNVRLDLAAVESINAAAC
jgi:hypothetical protein